MLSKNIEVFMGCDWEPEEADTILFGAPFDSTTSYRPGTRFGSGFLTIFFRSFTKFLFSGICQFRFYFDNHESFSFDIYWSCFRRILISTCRKRSNSHNNQSR